MKSARLDDMVKGWIVGDFDPCCIRDENVEVGVKYYKAGDKEELHHHKVATELTTIAAGKVRMLDRVWIKGDIITIEPGEASAFEALEDSITVVVKFPSVAGDKYLGSAD